MSESKRLKILATALEGRFLGMVDLDETIDAINASDDEIIFMLIQFLVDEEWGKKTQLGAIQGIFLMAHFDRGPFENAVPMLIKSFVHDSRDPSSDFAVSRNAALALGQIGPGAKEAIPILIDALEHSASSVAGASAKALGKIGPDAKAALPWLLEALKTPVTTMVRDDSAFPNAALIALQGIGIAATPGLVQLLGNKSSHVRHHAVYILGRIGPDAIGTANQIVPLLEDSNADVRAAALGTLRTIGWQSDPDLSFWRNLFVNGTKHDRLEAIRAIRALGDLARPALPELMQAVEDRDVDIRWRAIATLRCLGHQATAAVEVLSNALSDPSEFVRSYAALALYRIAPEAPRRIRNAAGD